MKKYRLELSIALILALLVVALLWTNLASVAPQLPIGLLAACVVALISVIAPWPERDAEGRVISSPSERYAPKEFFSAVVWSVVGIAIIIGLAVLLNRERFSKTFDLTQRQVNTLSTETLNVLKELKTEIKIFCVPSPNPRERYCDESGQLRRLYADASPKIQHEALSIADQRAIQAAGATGMSRHVLVTADNRRNEVAGAVTESKLTNAILNLTKSKRIVYFLTGNGEHPITMEGDRHFFGVAESLRNRAYEVLPHKITDELPADAQMLIIGPARAPYTVVVENMLRRFLARGGRLILMLNPYVDSGLSKLLSELGVKLEPTLLINNQGATAFGGQIAQINPLRPPIAISEFSRQSPLTEVFQPSEFTIADGARPMSFEAPTGTDPTSLKVKGTMLMTAAHAAPVTITEEQRNRLPREGDLRLTPDAGFDKNKTYPVAFDLEIENPQKLAEGIPSATLAANDAAGKVALDSAAGSAAQDKAKAESTSESKDKITSGVVVMGFDPAFKSDQNPFAPFFLPVAVAHLGKEKDLVSIPNKDFAPKRFKTERNPGGFLLLFAFLLPLLTALSGFYIYARRRSA